MASAAAEYSISDMRLRKLWADRPLENRGPFGTIATKLPGVRLCEHLPKQAAMLDKFTVIRSVDCRYSSHAPNTVMQTAVLDAEPGVAVDYLERVDPETFAPADDGALVVVAARVGTTRLIDNTLIRKA